VANAPEEQRALIVQKMMLLKAYLLSSSVQRARDSGHAKATAPISEANALLKQAQVDVENDRFQKAGEALDNGLRLASLGASFAAKHQSSTEQEARKYAKLLSQIESYLTAVRSALVESDSKEQRIEALADVEDMVLKAERLAKSEQYREANEHLTSAYQLSVTLITNLRKGTTLVSSLSFASPANEFEYERQRHDSYRLLVSIMLEERHALTKRLKSQSDYYLKESEQFREEAERQAATGEYPVAIQKMEEATVQLIRILQAAGLPVTE
jgi:uncharacterized protein YfkK (UPF0435 family)